MFVVFEGIDGSGKTTVSNQVAERLRSSGISVKHLRAEGKFVSAVTEAIRDLGRDARNLELVPQAEFLLYVARDVQLIEEALRPALGKYDIVLADRFLYTAENLGGPGRHLPAAFTAPILQAAAGGLVPDLVVLVDVDPVLARARRKAHKLAVLDRRPPSRKGLAGVGLQHRLRRGYLELAAAAPERWVVIANEDSLEATVERVTALVQAASRDGVPAALAAFQGRQRAAAPSAVAPRAPQTLDEALSSFLGWVDARMVREPRVAAYMLGGMCGPGVDERRRQLAEQVPEAVLAALTGLQDEASWALRHKLSRSHARAVARSLSGVSSGHPLAHNLRAALEPEAPEEVLASISRLDDPEAWAIRERLLSRYPSLVVASMASLSSLQAWGLRQRWLDEQSDRLEQHYELARAAARSVSGLSEPRAWQVRERVRSIAPVAALASLAGLDDDRSWQWREQALFRAPKVVMGTLSRLDDARAWRLRRLVARDCKEALDSIHGLDAADAWHLRDESLDIWPSTVAKTLGVLADSPRGVALLSRQLRAYPDNVSLLKYASSVALGLHRLLFAQDE